MTNSYFPKKFTSNETCKSNQEVIKSSNLKDFFEILVQLTYAVGCYNSYTSGLMKLLENSMFRNSVYIDTMNNFYVIPDSKNSSKDINNSSINYLTKIKNVQEQFSKTIIYGLNKKLRKMESILDKTLPEFQNSYRDQIDEFGSSLKVPKKGKKNSLKEKKSIFPKLFVYKINNKNLQITKIENIRDFSYPHCSEMMLLQTTLNQLWIFDLINRQITKKIKNFNFSLSKVLVKRNLSGYQYKLMPQKNCIRLNEFLKKIEMVFYEDKKESSKSDAVIFTKDVDSIIHSIKIVNEYFQKMEQHLWINPDFINESFSIIMANDEKNELLYFNYEIFYKKKSKFESEFNNTHYLCDTIQEHSMDSLYQLKRKNSLRDKFSFSKRYVKKALITI